MRKFFALLVWLVAFQSSAQLIPNGNSGSSTTSYTNGAPNDPVYIWCSDVLGTNQGSLTATPTSGVGPYTFNWFYHNQANSTWTLYQTQAGMTSTVNALPSDGYRVIILDASMNVVDCFTAWVWNLNTQVVASNNQSNCNQANLSSTVNTTGSFTYYNPPPPPSLITSSTQIQVCFNATHTWVSDLAFYLVGPPGCGSPTILLSPNPGAIGQGSICNSGDNVVNLCFTTTPAGNLNVCSPAPATLSGTYSSYGPSATPINWSPLYGCNAAESGWSVQIYDCIGSDVGALTNATISFSNLMPMCGASSTITYNSGAINSAINDNSCSAGTASIFQVPPVNLTTPINMTATTTLQWTANPATAITNSTNASATATGLPEGNTDFILTATSSFGSANCTSDDTTTFSYALPLVDAGNNQAACDGAQVTLSGSGTAVSYSWDNGVTNGVAFTPAGTTTYTVTGTDAAGCTNTDQVTVSVSTSPNVGAGNDQSICPGGTVTLNGSGAVSYTWDNGVTDGVAFNPASTTTYTVTGTDAAGCSNTDQVTVTVNTLPNVDAGTNQSICPGGSVILSGSGAVSYSWNNGVTNGVQFNPAITNVYTVTGTDANGCTNTDQVTVTVNPLPNVSAGPDQSVCGGTQVTLSGSGAQTYVWNLTVVDGVPFTPGATQIYTVVGTDANGCQNSDQVTVTVNPPPTISAGADQTVCLGMPVTLSGSGGVTYSWNNGVTNGVAFNPGLGNTVYTVTGTDANGCTNTDQVTVTVVPVPTSDLNSAGPLSGYPGLTVTFTNNSSNATSYVWDYDNGDSDATNNINQNGSSVFNSPGIYTVVLTASNGICDDTAQMQVIVIPYEPLVIHVPNVFTPDGDGVNDNFMIDTENATSMNVIIVNRWGEFIAEINDLTSFWDGTSKGSEMSEGVYFFTYSIGGKDGTTQEGHGFVELVRK